jgi:deazaflavin-dependent oxidoreductase (nitroreductase family)
MTDSSAGPPPAWTGPAPPTGATRALLQAPVWLYRLHLGRLLGGRFLLLRHRGRKTGQPHDTVLEVIGRQDDEVFVISGFGPRAAWLLNIQAAPPLLVQTGSRRFVPLARFLDEQQAAAILAEYAGRYPRSAAALGKRLYGGEFSPERLASSTTVVGLRPAQPAAPGN